MEEDGKDQVEGVYAAEIPNRRLIDGEVEDSSHNESAKPDRDEQPLPLRLIHSSCSRFLKGCSHNTRDPRQFSENHPKLN